MKKYILGLLTLTLIFACKEDKKETVELEETTEVAYTPIQDEDLENAIIYEANIRQYSPEGTFNEFTKDIPQLKELGVKVIWLMPIFPISEKNRKAHGDLLVEDIKDPKEREKYLGSYYAIANYEKVNPDLGTDADLMNLIKTAHDNGMYVILDWVANHTGWDNVWMKKYPDFYTKDENGKMMHPAGTDWTDTADLNYDNHDLWDAMTGAMTHWVTEFDIDGFRCDVAHEVPTEFWNYASENLQKQKPLFMLAESEKKDLFRQAFDMGYNWEGHHIMNELAQGKATVDKWDEYMQRNKENYEEDDILMNFITNHDENSWNGSVNERMGDKAQTMLAFSYVIPGMPLIYSGQEYDMDYRLKFFEKDTIPKTKGKTWDIMKKLGALKANNPALHGGKNAASYERLKTSDDSSIYAIKREKDGETIFYIANFSENRQNVKVEGLQGTVSDALRGGSTKFTEENRLDLPPYGYRILTLEK
ncbi:maltogenic amylase-like enzyme [Nonlabens dokdonensis]|uniref:Alpha-amylase n=2 Tax=Nonlabens dokdonensis TaxID=328515 RepID=L7W7H7_NONDD|nr:alpha-amylase family glycosyl hydrolase [Nonlabens dokdonensis]AGC76104.1 alpha-amylase [Nonlabens dokdonensis DSW-6]PZX43775.1 maltogenic amylase-like enzyme [Nonlabens dokdonensis]